MPRLEVVGSEQVRSTVLRDEFPTSPLNNLWEQKIVEPSLRNSFVVQLATWAVAPDGRRHRRSVRPTVGSQLSNQSVGKDMVLLGPFFCDERFQRLPKEDLGLPRAPARTRSRSRSLVPSAHPEA